MYKLLYELESCYMFSRFMDMEQCLQKDYKIINKNDFTDESLKTYIFNHPEQNIFIQTDKQTYCFVHTSRDEKITYIPTVVIQITHSVKDLINVLKDDFIVLAKDDQGQICGYLDTRLALHQIEKQCRYIEAFTDGILDTTNVPCTAIDNDQRVLFWTKAAEELFSIPAEEIIGKKITDFFEPDHLEILNTLEKGTSVKNQKHYAREDLIVMINSSPVFLDDEIIGAVVSETDITSYTRLNDELYEASKRLFNLEKQIMNPAEDPFVNVLGNSKKIKQTIKFFERAATTDANILISGESGTGKKMFAKALHHLRESSDAPFVTINCGAIPESLFEREMFGYDINDPPETVSKVKIGKAELAQNGTIFLDDVCDMPLTMQAKLLKLLQDKRFCKINSSEAIEINFRIIASTTKDLKELVDKGLFREDLYYHLNAVETKIPPLRDRPEDIIELTHYFLHEYSIKYNRPIHGISQPIMQAILSYDWPGNVRELENVIRRLVVFSDKGELQLEQLPFHAPLTSDQMEQLTNKQLTLKEQLEEYERRIIIHELDQTNDNKKECAKNLGITRATLYNRMNRLKIDF